MTFNVLINIDLATISIAGAGIGIVLVFNGFLTALAKNPNIENKLFVYLFIMFFGYIYYCTHNSSVVYAMMDEIYEEDRIAKAIENLWSGKVREVFPLWPDISYFELYKDFGSSAQFVVDQLLYIRDQYGPETLKKIIKIYKSNERYYLYDYLVCYSAEQPPSGERGWRESTIFLHSLKLDPNLILQIVDAARDHPDYTSQYNPRWGRGYIVTEPKPWMANGPSLFSHYYGDRIGYTFVGLLAATIIFILYSSNKG